MQLTPITAETIQKFAADWHGMELTPEHAQATVVILNVLKVDMLAARAMAVGDEEPATIYHALEGGSVEKKKT